MHKHVLPAVDDFDLILFGGSGDLAMRKILPAMYLRDHAGHWPDGARILCVAIDHLDTASFTASLAARLQQAVPAVQWQEATWQRFKHRLDYLQLDVLDAAGYSKLASLLRPQATRVFYLATPSAPFATIAAHLAQAGLVTPSSRIVLEKPLGLDLASARSINAAVGHYFTEQQIYRIDHYLGKEPVQNLLALRFGNILFEPLWRREWIANVQITIAEDIGVGSRAHYYEQAGALRDMLQNHLLQLLCITAMEPPVSSAADDVRDEKLKVLRSLHPLTSDMLATDAVRGQYRAGHINGMAVPAYLNEPGVADESQTETFVALRAEINNWRWAGVPFFLRTGKRMAGQLAEIVVQFKSLPHHIFDKSKRALPNCMVIRLQPDETLFMYLMAKPPGEQMKLRPVELELDFQAQFRMPRMSAYERLLVDVLRGQLTLFMRSDELEAAWEWVEPILSFWEQDGSAPLPYKAGTWGPAAASALLGRDGFQWREDFLPDN